MAITNLPTPPARSDTPANFIAKADAFVAALPTFVAEANAQAAALTLNSTTDTSATSNTIGTGAKTFTVSAGKSFQPGMYLVIADTAAPSTNSMFGQVTSYSGTSLVMNIMSSLGSGTKTAWTISQSSSGGASRADVQGQLVTAFTSAGTAPTYTVTTSPAYGAYSANQRMRLKFHAANSGAASTLNMDGLGAKSIKQYDSGGIKVTAIITVNQLADLEYDGTDFVILDPLPSVDRSYLAGLTMSTAGASTTMSIAAGQAADAANQVMMTLAAAINKTTSAWAVGSGNGGLDEATIANNKSYSFFLIQRPDTGVVDVTESLSPGTTATVTMTIASPAVITWADHGLQANAGIVFSTTGALPTGLVAGTRYYVSATGLAQSSFQVSATQGGASINTSGTQSGVHTATTPPALAANYTKYRRIGSRKTNGSGQWAGFIQDGDFFQELTTVLDVNATNPGTSAVTRTLSVPTGINVIAVMNANLSIATLGSAVYLSDLAVTDEVASTLATPLAQVANQIANSTMGGFVTVRTNTSAQIRSRLANSDASTVLRIALLGYYDRRGRDA